VNINLWAGLAMVVVALLFIGWALWRPLTVPAKTEQDAERPDADAATKSE
jgi:hypothetical protein